MTLPTTALGRSLCALSFLALGAYADEGFTQIGICLNTIVSGPNQADVATCDAPQPSPSKGACFP